MSKIKSFKEFIGESLFGNMSDKGRGEVVKKEDLIISNDNLKERIKKLYEDRGEGDTLDVSSLSKCIACDDFSKLFYNFNNVKQIIGLETWNVSKVTNMSSMFYYCESLTELDLSTWNVSKVTNMYDMFYGCSSLKELNISTWNVNNVIYMYDMFRFCESLKELNLSNWDMSNVTDMSGMFYGCKSLIELNISTWNVSNVTNMYDMFDYCNKLIKPKWYK